MDINEYQRYALKSVAFPKSDINALPHRTLGLSGEAGILANQVKRIIRDRQGEANPSDIEIISERLGDILYYSAALAEYFDLKLSDILEGNMQKSDAFRHSRNQPAQKEDSSSDS